ncbi:MAG: cbb3-type cytochrome c oxidase subunit I [Candidatus Dormibacteria bacterium]|jgi:cytochrome o ubiquinol oxidase subunit 1
MTVAGIFGRLTWSNLFPSVLVTQAAVVSIGLGLVAAVALVTYLRRWRWLWKEWLTTVDPKRIGVMYIIVAVLMLVRGGVDVVLMRAQQATSVGAAAGVVPTSTFQQLFSAHGTIMIFFVAMGLMFGIINLVVPLQIGARDVAFPFLNATSFWLFCAGMVLINASLGVGEFSAAGWLAYPPLSELRYSPGVGVDYWIWSLQIAGIGSLLSGINFFVTILRMRCRGMTLMRMPLFSWSVLCSMFLVMFAFPVLTVTLSLLFLDRAVGTHFFTAGAGGDMMMYVNLIWAWGHPEVYILVLPAFGIFSEVVATYSRKPLFGYVSMVLALAAITLLSFTVWVHHFFTMGAGADVNAFFGIMTMVIAIPTGVKIFNWLATMYRGRIHFSAPMYFFMGFVFLFTMGGVAGVMLAVPAIDYQLHNSLFLVAHFHTMIVSGVLFGDFAGLIYWLPKVIGFKMDDRLLKYSAWCWIVGFVLAFGPLYLLGFMGATRRTSHYASDTGWQPLFVVAGLGVAIIAVGVAIMLLQLLLSVQRRKQNRDTTGDPWNGRTLEWSIPSPVPVYNFAVLPVVEGRDAFWAAKQRGDASGAAAVRYEDILLPANTPAGLAIGMLAFVVGFTLIWQMYWATPLAILAIIVVLAIRTTATDDSERVITAAEVEGIERSRARAGLA